MFLVEDSPLNKCQSFAHTAGDLDRRREGIQHTCRMFVLEKEYLLKEVSSQFIGPCVDTWSHTTHNKCSDCRGSFREMNSKVRDSVGGY